VLLPVLPMLLPPSEVLVVCTGLGRSPLQLALLPRRLLLSALLLLLALLVRGCAV
jgi:hypothetical protein